MTTKIRASSAKHKALKHSHAKAASAHAIEAKTDQVNGLWVFPSSWDKFK